MSINTLEAMATLFVVLCLACANTTVSAGLREVMVDGNEAGRGCDVLGCGDGRRMTTTADEGTMCLLVAGRTNMEMRQGSIKTEDVKKWQNSLEWYHNQATRQEMTRGKRNRPSCKGRAENLGP
ncbi:hypothetical protein BD779DRAFT_1474108 [Infundibulicybe gibba]|nr:hypothetical protein BD779DRAFT_1474108 [Infundibulicybe gibba]